MILAHHSIFSMYGFWLPNDPRGSGSDYIAVWELFRYGRATKTDSRLSVARVQHDGAARLAAKEALRFPPVEITGRQALAVTEGFGAAIAAGGYRIHACAVLPDHVHLVIGAHASAIRLIVGHLKSGGTRALKSADLWAGDGRPVWGAHGWNVRLEDAASVERAIRYVEENPMKEGKRRQRSSLATPLDLEAAVQVASRPPGPRRRIGGAARRSWEGARRKGKVERVASERG